ncbi:MAG: hypothetical protein M1840_002206 [Geoglossum simile]|nr:MAG: hypothetical protein M1840_002206 [Geoglossum simile]
MLELNGLRTHIPYHHQQMVQTKQVQETIREGTVERMLMALFVQPHRRQSVGSGVITPVAGYRKTLYLLGSHANVHSTNRPNYCSYGEGGMDYVP